jgi:hypothetical protein
MPESVPRTNAFMQRIFYAEDMLFVAIVQTKLKFFQKLTKRVLWKDAVLCAALLLK